MCIYRDSDRNRFLTSLVTSMTNPLPTHTAGFGGSNGKLFKLPFMTSSTPSKCTPKLSGFGFTFSNCSDPSKIQHRREGHSAIETLLFGHCHVHCAIPIVPDMHSSRKGSLLFDYLLVQVSQGKFQQDWFCLMSFFLGKGYKVHRMY